jgi:ribonuclease BN (tRNA processing enzyme)
MNRSKPLVILGPRCAPEIVRQTLRLAYPSILEKLDYELRFVAVEPGDLVEEAGLVWRSALNRHSVKNLAVRIEKGAKSLFYSGDGLASDAAICLARNADLAIHEAFRLDREFPGHATFSSCIDFARKAKVRRLALVHVERNERRRRRDDIKQMFANVLDFEIFMPEPGDGTQI